MKTIFQRFRILVLTAGIVLSFVGTHAMAKDGAYVGGNLAFVKPGDMVNTNEFNNALLGMDLTTENKLSFKFGVGASILGGYQKGDMRAEVEFLTHKNDADKITQTVKGRFFGQPVDTEEEVDAGDGYLKQTTIFISGYKLFKKSGKVTPIGGIGLGSTSLSDGDDLSEKVLSVHFSGGLEGNINKNLSWSGMMRLIKYGKMTIEQDNGSETEYTFNVGFALQGGIKYQF